MICSKCNKRPAVVFVTRQEGGKTKNDGLCIQCAKDLGIKPVCDMLDKMGITDEMIDVMSDEMSNMFGEEGIEQMLGSGGAPVFPFLNELNVNADEKGDATDSKSSPKNNNKNKKDEKPDESRKFLNLYCVNLSQLASEGKIDNVIGREDEIFRVMQILNRRGKNNPCLIGEPGVGKTAIAEGLALRIARGQAPAKLLHKELFLLDLAALVAGTQFRGQFESRIKGLIQEVKKLGNIILVIDEIHNIVSSGDAEGSMNAGNILKPALSRGEVQIIGATTFTEYRKYIEKDSALERRFQPVTVNEPSINDTVEILKGIKNYYENHHRVIISDNLLYQATILSERYITDRYLPDKAIDLIDEAASYVNLTDKDSMDYDTSFEVLIDIHQKQSELVDDGSTNFYEQSAILRSQELHHNNILAQLEGKAPSVGIEHLARVIELWTGVPATKIKENEYEKLLTLESELKKHIIGQDKAVTLVSNAIIRSRVGLSVQKRPSSFIFSGPTGVGKTELVKQLALLLFNSPETLIRLDMSEFMEKHSVSRIIGSPPGYVGYDEAGQLTEKIRRKPYSIVLFDEIEKAHPDVLNILLQILDDGHITDAHGRTVNFENTVIVMTTNAGSDKKSGMVGFNSKGAMSEEATMKALREFLRPEFINRVDVVITFDYLEKDSIVKICRMMLDELGSGIKMKGFEFEYDDSLVEFIANKAFSLTFGARNLRRDIQKSVEDAIAAVLIRNYGVNTTKIKVKLIDGEIKIEIE